MRRGKTGVPAISDTRAAYVEGRFERMTCALCCNPVFQLGKAIRVDGAPEEGGWFRILHVCLSCVRRAARRPLAPAAERRAA